MWNTLALAALTACASANTDTLDKRAPLGCETTYNNGEPFQIGIVNISESTGYAMTKRQTNPNAMPGNALMLYLTDGMLTDQNNRTGYIASNSQLQFDTGAQAGAISTSGFSVCQNGTLALDNSALWYECLSVFEGRSFYNLYTMEQGSQCYMAYIQAIGADVDSDGGDDDNGEDDDDEGEDDGGLALASGMATTQAPIPTTAGSPDVVVSSSTVSLMSQITDGQVQAPTTGSVTVSSMTMTMTSATQAQDTDGAEETETSGASAQDGEFDPNAAAGVAGVSGWRMMGVVVAALGGGALLL